MREVPEASAKRRALRSTPHVADWSRRRPGEPRQRTDAKARIHLRTRFRDHGCPQVQRSFGTDADSPPVMRSGLLRPLLLVVAVACSRPADAPAQLDASITAFAGSKDAAVRTAAAMLESGRPWRATEILDSAYRAGTSRNPEILCEGFGDATTSRRE